MNSESSDWVASVGLQHLSRVQHLGVTHFGIADLVRAVRGALTRTGPERFGHDALDRAGAAAAFGAAAEAAVNLPCGTRQIHPPADGGADIVVGQNVAGADDH